LECNPILRIFLFWGLVCGVSLLVSPLMGELLFFACTKKSNQKKVHPYQMALRAALVNRCLVAPSRRVILTRAPFEWPSLAIHASRASFLGIFQGG
jgi:hypothetical protein